MYKTDGINLPERIVYLLLAAFCFLLYGKTLSYDLSWLDDYYLLIEAAPFLSELKNLPALFFTDVFITNPQGFYRPLLNVSFMADIALKNLSGVWFFSHLFNILFHTVAVCLFYKFLKNFRIKKGIASALSLLFAAHPSASVAVGWIPGRNDLLLAIFAFSSFIMLDRYRRDGEIQSVLRYSLLMSCALFTKESAVMLPFLCFLWLFICKNTLNSSNNEINAKEQSNFELFRADFNVFALFSLVPLIAWAFMRHLSSVGNTKIGIAGTLQNFLYLPEIIGRAVFPAWPVIVSPYSVLPHFAIMIAVFAAFSAFFACFAAKKLKKGCKRGKFAAFLVLFGFAWFIVFFMPTFAAGEGIGSGSSFFEHRLYLPLAGFLFAIGVAAGEIPENRKNFSFALTAVFTLFFSAVSLCHLSYYSDRYSFWRQVTLNMPDDYPTFVRAGQCEEQRGLDGIAAYYYRRALVLNPRQELLHASLAGIYYRSGDYENAEKEMLAELAMNPGYEKGRKWLEMLRKR